ncbi:hypothetical protein PENSPDRAFT_684917 [Peniophora sp. CONT]|nr:hypothetical protein PENSPDRAFT_684917 [Peniophora sp. CONT]
MRPYDLRYLSWLYSTKVLADSARGIALQLSPIIIYTLSCAHPSRSQHILILESRRMFSLHIDLQTHVATHGPPEDVFVNESEQERYDAVALRLAGHHWIYAAQHPETLRSAHLHVYARAGGGLLGALTEEAKRRHRDRKREGGDRAIVGKVPPMGGDKSTRDMFQMRCSSVVADGSVTYVQKMSAVLDAL